mmetsp:Transcript_1726/g.1639  ORF Transcript_1726/g.1639 Transcript_1726/m.1639 type:complete len:115 (+) Transcript_1726:1000-1344(+)
MFLISADFEGDFHAEHLVVDCADDLPEGAFVNDLADLVPVADLLSELHLVVALVVSHIELVHPPKAPNRVYGVVGRELAFLEDGELIGVAFEGLVVAEAEGLRGVRALVAHGVG